MLQGLLDKLQTAVDAKNDIKDALDERHLAPTDTFNTYPSIIQKLRSDASCYTIRLTIVTTSDGNASIRPIGVETADFWIVDGETKMADGESYDNYVPIGTNTVNLKAGQHVIYVCWYRDHMQSLDFAEAFKPIVGGSNTTWYKDVKIIDIPSDTWSYKNLFNGNSFITEFDSPIGTVTDISGMLASSAIKNLDMSFSTITGDQDMSSWASGCANLENAILPSMSVSGLEEAFKNAPALKSISLYGWTPTSACTSAKSMFSGCTELRSANLSGFDFSGLATIDNMFLNCKNLTIITGLDSVTLNPSATLSNFFAQTSLTDSTTLNLTGWTGALTSFYYQGKSTTSAPKFKGGTIQGMAMAYSGSVVQYIDIASGGSDFSSCSSLYSMCSGCSALRCFGVYASTALDFSSVSTVTNAFNGCTSLVSFDRNYKVTSSSGTTVYSECGTTSDDPDSAGVVFKNLGAGFTSAQTIDLSSCNLSQVSLVALFNGLATITNGSTIKLSATELARLTDTEKAIATGKGWTLA